MSLFLPVDGCNGSPPHVRECFSRTELPCPCCGEPVPQLRLICAHDPAAAQECDACHLLCKDCPSEVRAGLPNRWRVIHAATCPWLRRYLAREVTGTIPCGSTVTHRGPYVRRPA